MDRIKVLNKHILFEYNDLRDSEFVAWIKIMALTAELEHVPTRDQILKYVNYQTLDSLSLKLHKHSIDLPSILHKVLIDASYVRHRRDVWKNNKKQYREDMKNVSKDVSVDVSHIDKDIDKDIDKENIIIPSSANKSALCPHEEIISLYHKILPELPAVKIWTPKRKGLLKSRWAEDKARQSLEWWEQYFTKIKDSPFLTGNVTDFKASLEWVVNQANMVKIIEGKYDGGRKNVGIKTNRSDPRDSALQSREDAEIQGALALWQTAKKSSIGDTRRTADNDDVPDFSDK